MFRRRWAQAALTLIAVVVFARPCAAQTPPAAAAPSQPSQASPATEQSPLLKSTEAFVRKLFAWGPEFKVKLGPLKQSPAEDFYLVPVEVTFNGQTDTGEVYVSKDGKSLVRGQIFDMAADPFADNRAKLHAASGPSAGPADARVTIVEFFDYECPHCREMHTVLNTIESQYPQVRIIFMDFPITQIHPWADTAAIGAHCVYTQSLAAYPKLQDYLFDNQDVISAEDIWDKLLSFVSENGLDATALKTCMSSPEAAKAVQESRDLGVALKIDSTPTLFINGRPLIGGDVSTVKQQIDFELAAHPK